MKSYRAVTLLLTFSSLLCAKDGVFSGEVMDKQCAQMGSHQNMMASEGAKDARECTLACTKNGDPFALMDSSTKKVYVLDDGSKVRPYAGQHVQITGSYDESSGILHVKSVAKK